MGSVADIIQAINSIIWSPALVVILIGAGLYFSIRTRFVQIRHIPLMFKLLAKGSGSDRKGVSSFEAFSIAISGRVGSGNIVGVALAIAFGGPGAIFWMWVIAFVGAATAFMESTLANNYRIQHSGGWIGGPAAYIEHGLKKKRLGLISAFVTILSYGFLVVPLQANSVTSAFQNSFSVPPIISGVIIGILLALVIVGGTHRIAKVASFIGPFMAIFFLIAALVIIICNYERIPSVLASIFEGAFGFGPAFGGILGSTISMGVKRGLFSNEAGQGTGAIVSAAANAKHPVEQGLIQALTVYIDTILVCTATALMILCTGCYNVYDQATGEALEMHAPELADAYVTYSQAAIDTIFPNFGGGFIAVAMAFFVFSSLIACFFYSQSSIKYLCSSAKLSDKIYNFINRFCQAGLIIMVLFGAVSTPGITWTIGDIGMGLATWINIIALILLSPKAIALLKDFETNKQETPK